jgi:hypothetical protein
MLKYKPVTVEKLVCTCDRCGRAMEEGLADFEWQERFIISFRGGFGSVFGDGNLVEGDFCQECIHAVLGKYLRVIIDDPFEAENELSNDAEKILQPYQFKKLLGQKRMQSEITSIFKESGERAEKRKQLAERLCVSEDQVGAIALDYLLQSLEKKQTKESAQADTSPSQQ